MSDQDLSLVAPSRQKSLEVWVQTVFPKTAVELEALLGDASFRRYYRLRTAGCSYIVMDAPPVKENCLPFVAIAKAWHRYGINVPEIHSEDLEQGFLLLTDFGDDLLLQKLNRDNVDHYYQQALDQLMLIQRAVQIEQYPLPKFSEDLLWREMQLFPDWYLSRHRQFILSQAEQKILHNTMRLLIEEILMQPSVCVHRDYHSRNLLVTDKDLAVLDFQDAVIGPITYDLLSLVRDCYIDWPYTQVAEWVEQFRLRLCEAGMLGNISKDQFLRWFDWATLQRNLKCIGIFARLANRDGKLGYLPYIPRVVGYALTVTERYPEFRDMHGWLMDRLEAV